MLPQEIGCGSGMTCWRRLRDWHQAKVWQALHEIMLAKLEAGHLIDWSRASVDSIFVRANGAKKGGPSSQAVGASPVDRGRPGTKRHQAVDRGGLPLATVLSGANVPDGQKLLATVDAIPFVRDKRGRPRHRPEKVHADKAYDDKKLRRGLRKRGVVPRLARRGVESGEKLGHYC